MLRDSIGIDIGITGAYGPHEHQPLFLLIVFRPPYFIILLRPSYIVHYYSLDRQL
jgi:hypothetical protein